ncbi:MAG: DUF4360 domain-containing protein [Stigonema ocellatum SAG 48.90 = DSM 106950]|nr:DUF4360 domain-containing protein [Stigonema ocellatum SAG 48.90 = DSM 106950]
MNGKTQRLWQMGLLSAVVLGLNIPSAVLAQVPPPGSVTIETINAGGSGCPAGSTRATISSDRTQAQLFFDKFITQLSPVGVTPLYPSTTDCTVSYNIKYPSGWSLSLEKVQLRGSVNTRYGATGTLSSLFYIPGLNVDTVVEKDFPKNQQGFFLIEQAAPVLAYTGCGAVFPLNVTTELSLNGQTRNITGNNQLRINTEDLTASTIVNFNWRRC